MQKLTRDITANNTKTNADHPHCHFHAEVIRRAKQNILTLKGHLTSFHDAILLSSEKANNLKDGLMQPLIPMQRPSGVYITENNSTGFKSLRIAKDQTFEKHMITLVKTDNVNMNTNAIIDKGCQESEEEIKYLEPDGHPMDIP